LIESNFAVVARAESETMSYLLLRTTFGLFDQSRFIVRGYEPSGCADDVRGANASDPSAAIATARIKIECRVTWSPPWRVDPWAAVPAPCGSGRSDDA
jgi:hypothetical protein